MQEDITKKENQEIITNPKTNPDGTNQIPEKNEENDEDASTKEIILYSFASIANQSGVSFNLLLSQILTITLAISPIFVGAILAMKTLWDAVTDPIMASVSDNFRSRWGRRRPFILLGGVVMPLLGIIAWSFLPESPKTKPNKPVIPTIERTEKALIQFGKMLKAYDVPGGKIRIMPLSNSSGKSIPESTQYILENAVEKMRTSVSYILNGNTNIKADLILNGSVLALSENISPETGMTDDKLTTVVSVSKPDNSALVSSTNNVEIIERLSEGSEGRSIFSLLEGDSQGIFYNGENIDFKINVKQKKLFYRALVCSLEMSLIESLGKYYKVPYWKCFPENANIKSDIEERFIAVHPVSSNLFMAKLKKLAYASDYKVKLFEALYLKRMLAKLDKIKDAPDTKKRKELISSLNDNDSFSKATGIVNKLKENKEFSVAMLGNLKTTIEAKLKKIETENLAEIEKIKNEKELTDNKSLYVSLWKNLNISSAELRNQTLKKQLNKKPKKGKIAKIVEAAEKFGQAPLADKKILIFMLVILLCFATFQTIFGVPYYALGIELAPSYDGRTKLVQLRSFFQQIMALLNPWFWPFCLLPLFANSIKGAAVLATILACIAIPAVILTFFNTKERTHVDKSKKKVNILKSIKLTFGDVNFLKIAALYIIILCATGLFQQMGMFLTTYYVFKGDLLKGGTYVAGIGTFAYLLTLASIPLIGWLCKKYQKHNALRIAIILMIIGCVLKWFCYNPDKPYLLWILPFFFSLGISSVYTVLSTMMADVTDLDELRTGSRREGMFGAVNSWLMKTYASIQVLMVGILIVAAGFDVELGVNQAPGVFTKMRILFSVVSASILAIALLILIKYPLTRTRMEEIKAELKARG